jgi:hypothetical protein
LLGDPDDADDFGCVERCGQHVMGTQI